jgi:outer membrane protein assembly factor BamD (BamD/ComL family)
MEAQRAVARYELGNALFLAAGRPDSAATWYRRILEENSDQPVAQKALYALAESHRARGDSAAAQKHYERLIEKYPDSELASRARARLNRAEDTAGEGRPAQADSAYARAYRRWQTGAWEPALEDLLAVARRYPDAEVAPRALLASGVIYWQRAQVDTATVPEAALTSYLRDVRPPDTTGPDTATTEAASAEPRLPAAARDTVGRREASGASPRTDSTTGSSGAPTRSPPPDTLQADPLESDRPERPDSAVATSGRDGPAAVPPDTAAQQVGGAEGVSTDTTVADSTAADSTADRFAPLEALMTHLQTRYAKTPQADRARTVLDMIDERRQPADTVAADSAQGPDAARDSAALARSTPEPAPDRASPRADSGQTSPTRPRRAASERDSTSRDTAQAKGERLPVPARATAPPDSGTTERAVWTVFVRAYTDSVAASSRVRSIEQGVGSRWPVRLVRRPNAAGHLLVVGRFDSKDAARQARDQLRARVSEPLTVRRLPSGS